LHRRNEQEGADAIFFQALQAHNEGNLDEGTREMLLQESAEEKRNIGQLLHYNQLLAKGFAHYENENYWSDYASLLKTATEAGMHLSENVNKRIAKGFWCFTRTKISGTATSVSLKSPRKRIYTCQRM